MLGPSGRRSPQTVRRDRRRLAIGAIVLVVVAIVVGELIDDLVKSGPPTAKRTRETWMSVVGGFVADANTLSPELGMVRADATNPADFDRVSLELTLDRLSQAATEELHSFDQLAPQAPNAKDGSLTDDVFSWRAAALSKLERGVNAAIGGDPSGSASADLSAAGSQLVAADSAYASLVSRMGHGDPLPSSAWLARPDLWSSGALSSWSTQLSSAANLRAAPSLSIVDLSIEPPPLRISGLPASTTTSTTTTVPGPTTTAPGSTTTTTAVGGSTTTTSSTSTTTTLPAPTTTSQIPPGASTSVIAPTSSVRVALVVEDSGNTDVSAARAVAVLDPNPRGVRPAASVHVVLGALTPGQSTYVLLPKLKVSRATSYALSVTVTYDGRAVRRSVTLSVVG